MKSLKDVINFLILIMNAGASFRILYCILKIIPNADEAQSYKKKIINALIFLVLANSVLALTEVIKKYFNYS